MIDSIGHALMITGFVAVMMLVIEYVNVATRGRWEAVLSRHRGGQLLLCAFLGATPGCLGAYAVGSLYMHRVVTFGALVAAMVATCGDEAFVMLAMFPERALLLMGILLGTGLISGVAVDRALRGRRTRPREAFDAYVPVHHEEARCTPFSRREVVEQWKHCSEHRIYLTLLLSLFIVAVLGGWVGHHHLGVEVGARESPVAAASDAQVHAHDEHDEHATPGSRWDWLRVTLLLSGLIGLAIIATVPDHFLEEHLWNHLVKVHVWRIFLWTLGALLVVRLLTAHLHLHGVAGGSMLWVMLVACLVGLIPSSGPHLVFVVLYAEGSVPFSVLLASSIVQNGHGMIPMLAHSRRAFVGVKVVGFAAGLAAGLAALALGW